jgi:hypothetical protein
MYIQQLADQLKSIAPGPVSRDMRPAIFGLLKQCWNEFSGTSDTSMESWKVDREEAEDVTWEPPFLSFTILRHGGAVAGGSTREERQRWSLDIQKQVAHQQIVGHRQLRPSASPLRAAEMLKIARQVCQTVRKGPNAGCSLERDGRIIWKSQDLLHIKHARLIPDTGFAKTLSGRRKRFRAVLAHEMAAIGWRCDGVVGQVLVFVKEK